MRIREEEYYFKWRTIGVLAVGVSEATVKRWARRAGLRLIEWRGAVLLPRNQGDHLKARFRRSRLQISFAILKELS